jgi:hypothetical protein
MSGKGILGDFNFLETDNGKMLENIIDGLRIHCNNDCVYPNPTSNSIANDDFSEASVDKSSLPADNIVYNYFTNRVYTIYYNTIYRNSPPPRAHHKMYFNYEGNNDLFLFLKGALSGSLYDDLNVMNGFASRDQAKDHCMKLFFGFYKKEDTVTNNTENNFPITFQIVNSLKGHYAYSCLGKKNKNELDYFILREVSSELPLFLQRVESEIFIDNILVTLYAQGINALSVHDSFLIPQSQYEQAISFIYSELQRFLPFGFELKIKHPGEGSEERIKYTNEEHDIASLVSSFLKSKLEFASLERA